MSKKAISLFGFLRKLRLIPQFVGILLLIIRVRVSLNLVGLERTREKLLMNINARQHNIVRRSDIIRMIKLVTFASSFVPKANCLTQALALQRLLCRFPFKTNLVIGVKSENKGTFTAHAWLTTDDALLIGGPQEKIDQYSPINQFEFTP